MLSSALCGNKLILGQLQKFLSSFLVILQSQIWSSFSVILTGRNQHRNIKILKAFEDKRWEDDGCKSLLKDCLPRSKNRKEHKLQKFLQVTVIEKFLVVSIGLFWVLFMPFLYHGEYYRPSTLALPPTCRVHTFPPPRTF